MFRRKIFLAPVNRCIFSIEHDLQIIAMPDTVFADSRSVYGAAPFIQRMSGLCDSARVLVAHISVPLRAPCFVTAGVAGEGLEGRFGTLTVVN